MEHIGNTGDLLRYFSVYIYINMAKIIVYFADNNYILFSGGQYAKNSWNTKGASIL